MTSYTVNLAGIVSKKRSRAIAADRGNNFFIDASIDFGGAFFTFTDATQAANFAAQYGASVIVNGGRGR